jgi:trk system potassium uptake protein TrkA
MPHHDTVIEAGDHLCGLSFQQAHVRAVERLFQVSATFF